MIFGFESAAVLDVLALLYMLYLWSTGRFQIRACLMATFVWAFLGLSATLLTIVFMDQSPSQLVMVLWCLLTITYSPLVGIGFGFWSAKYWPITPTPAQKVGQAYENLPKQHQEFLKGVGTSFVRWAVTAAKEKLANEVHEAGYPKTAEHIRREI